MKRSYTNLYIFAMRFHFVKQDFKTMQTDFEITPPTAKHSVYLQQTLNWLYFKKGFTTFTN